MQLRTQLTLAAGLFLLAPVVLFFSIDFLRDRVVKASYFQNVHTHNQNLYQTELRRLNDGLELSFFSVTSAVQDMENPRLDAELPRGEAPVWPEMQARLEELTLGSRNISMALFDQSGAQKLAGVGANQSALHLAVENFDIQRAQGLIMAPGTDSVLAIRLPIVTADRFFVFVAAMPVNALGRRVSESVEGAVFISTGQDNDIWSFVAHDRSDQFGEDIFPTLVVIDGEEDSYEVRSDDHRGYASRFPLTDLQGQNAGSIIIVRDTTEETIREEKQDRLVYGGFTVLILASIILLLWYFNRSFRPLSQIIDALQALTRHDFDWELPRLNRRDELGLLADTLHDYRESLIDRERLEDMSEKMEFAAEIQRSILPSKMAISEYLGVEANMIPAEEIGGDFYDYFQMADGRTAIVVADVADKGPGSALFGALAGAMIRATARLFSSPAEIMSAVNSQLCDRNDAKLFVTLFFGLFDPKTGQLTYCNAGHEPPFVMQVPELGASCRIEKLPQTKGIPLGLMAEGQFEETSFQLSQGDSVVLYTDGITEATNTAGILYSRDRLEKMLGRLTRNDPKRVMEEVLAAVEAFAGDSGQADDITLLIARVDKLMQQPVVQGDNVEPLDRHRKANEG